MKELLTSQSCSEAVGGWSPGMGGALELLARDAAGPTDVVRRVYPRNNMLAFFKVGLDSYHQVSNFIRHKIGLQRSLYSQLQKYAFHRRGQPSPIFCICLGYKERKLFCIMSILSLKAQL